MSTINRTVLGLLPDTGYVIRIRSYNGLGVASDWSEAFMVATEVSSSTSTQTVSQSYVISGSLQIASGAAGYLPPFFVPVPDGQTVVLSNVRTMVRAGTCTLNIKQNSSTVITGINITTSPTSTAANITIHDGDILAPILTAVNAADGLSCSFYFDITV